MVARLPSRLLRLEGLAVAVAALVLYFHADYGWLLLLLLILAPDLSALGYLADRAWEPRATTWCTPLCYRSRWVSSV